MARNPPAIVCPGYRGSNYNQEPHQCELSEFYQVPGRGNLGHSYRCKECHCAQQREYFRTEYYPLHRDELIDAVLKRRQGG